MPTHSYKTTFAQTVSSPSLSYSLFSIALHPLLSRPIYIHANLTGLHSFVFCLIHHHSLKHRRLLCKCSRRHAIKLFQKLSSKPGLPTKYISYSFKNFASAGQPISSPRKGPQ